MIKSKEEAVGGVKLLNSPVTFNEADVKRQTDFVDMMGLEATKSSMFPILLKLVGDVGRR